RTSTAVDLRKRLSGRELDDRPVQDESYLFLVPGLLFPHPASSEAAHPEAEFVRQRAQVRLRVTETARLFELDLAGRVLWIDALRGCPRSDSLGWTSRAWIAFRGLHRRDEPASGTKRMEREAEDGA